MPPVRGNSIHDRLVKILPNHLCNRWRKPPHPRSISVLIERGLHLGISVNPPSQPRHGHFCIFGFKVFCGHFLPCGPFAACFLSEFRSFHGFYRFYRRFIVLFLICFASASRLFLPFSRLPARRGRGKGGYCCRLHAKAASYIVNSFGSDVHTRFLPCHRGNELPNLRPAYTDTFVGVKAASSTHAVNVKHRAVLGWRCPSRDDFARSVEAVSADVILD